MKDLERDLFTFGTLLYRQTQRDMKIRSNLKIVCSPRPCSLARRCWDQNSVGQKKERGNERAYEERTGKTLSSDRSINGGRGPGGREETEGGKEEGGAFVTEANDADQVG